jgi:hypothetical protein
MARSREPIWLALAATASVVAAALLGIAVTFDVASKTAYPLWVSLPMIAAYAAFGLVLACTVCAIRDVPIRYPFSRRGAEPSAPVTAADSRMADPPSAKLGSAPLGVQNITASAPGAVAQGAMFGNVINIREIPGGSQDLTSSGDLGTPAT